MCLLAIQAVSVKGQATVGTSTVNDNVGDGYQRKSFVTEGLFWSFYFDGTNAGWEFSADGTTWDGAFTSIGACDTAKEFSIWFDGTYVHYTRHGEWTNHNLYYRRGTPVNDGSITWSAVEQTVFSGGSTNEYTFPTITVDSNGYAWVGAYFDKSDGTDYPIVLKNANNDGTWSNDFVYVLNNTIDSPFWRVTPIPLTDGKVYVIYATDGVLPLGRLYAGGWGAEENDLGDYNIINPHYGAYSAVANGNDVHFVYTKVAPAQIRYNNRTFGVGWMANDVLVQDSVTIGLGSALSTDLSTGDLYCFWASYATDHVYYKKWNATNGWGIEVDWIDESSDSIQQDYFISSSYTDYGDYIGFLYGTRSANPWNVKFAFLSTGSAPAEAPLALTEANHNATEKGLNCEFTSEWSQTGDPDLKHAIFEWDITGSYTQAGNVSLSGKTDWANLTLVLPTNRTTINYRFTAHNTYGNTTISSNNLTLTTSIPTNTDLGVNSTIANKNAGFYSSWTQGGSGRSLDKGILEIDAGGGYAEIETVSVSGGWANFSYLIPWSLQGDTHDYRVTVNNTYGETNVSSILQFTVLDPSPVSVQDGINSSRINATTLFYSEWTEDASYPIDTVLFVWDVGAGNVSFPVSVSGGWANISKYLIPAYDGLFIPWFFQANNSAGNQTLSAGGSLDAREYKLRELGQANLNSNNNFIYGSGIQRRVLWSNSSQRWYVFYTDEITNDVKYSTFDYNGTNDLKNQVFVANRDLQDYDVDINKDGDSIYLVYARDAGGDNQRGTNNKEQLWWAHYDVLSDTTLDQTSTVDLSDVYSGITPFNTADNYQAPVIRVLYGDNDYQAIHFSQNNGATYSGYMLANNLETSFNLSWIYSMDTLLAVKGWNRDDSAIKPSSLDVYDKTQLFFGQQSWGGSLNQYQDSYVRCLDFEAVIDQYNSAGTVYNASLWLSTKDLGLDYHDSTSKWYVGLAGSGYPNSLDVGFVNQFTATMDSWNLDDDGDIVETDDKSTGFTDRTLGFYVSSPYGNDHFLIENNTRTMYRQHWNTTNGAFDSTTEEKTWTRPWTQQYPYGVADRSSFDYWYGSSGRAFSQYGIDNEISMTWALAVMNNHNASGTFDILELYVFDYADPFEGGATPTITDALFTNLQDDHYIMAGLEYPYYWHTYVDDVDGASDITIIHTSFQTAGGLINITYTVSGGVVTIPLGDDWVDVVFSIDADSGTTKHVEMWLTFTYSTPPTPFLDAWIMAESSTGGNGAWTSFPAVANILVYNGGGGSSTPIEDDPPPPDIFWEPTEEADQEYLIEIYTDGGVIRLIPLPWLWSDAQKLTVIVILWILVFMIIGAIIENRRRANKKVRGSLIYVTN